MRIVLEISKQGNRFWFTENTLGVLKYHRDNDMPAVIFCDGDKRWYKDDNLIREEICWERLINYIK